MRVVCIESGKALPNQAAPQKGYVYTVIDSKEEGRRFGPGYTTKPGLYYRLLEIGVWSHSCLFIEIIEDQQDETEFDRVGVTKEMQS